MIPGVSFRLATPEDAQQLFLIRRESIAVLAPRGMPSAKAIAWSTNLTLAGMQEKLRELEIWIAETGSAPVGWGGIRDNYLAGLYIHPDCAGRGIGTHLLVMLEGLMRKRGHEQVRADASENAEGYYLRRGDARAGAPKADGGLPLIKDLK